MATREIVTLPTPILRRVARKVVGFGPELQTLIDDMVETMREAPGLGLAATQINVPLRVIVVEYSDDEDEAPPKLYTVINPKLSRFSKETEVGIEGCLSVPEFVGDVERSTSVTLKGFNRHGKRFRVNASGWLARVFQHEVDHLDGVLFIDRAENIRKLEEEPTQVVPAD